MIVFISHVILSEILLNETKNQYSAEKDEKVTYRQMPQSYSQF